MADNPTAPAPTMEAAAATGFPYLVDALGVSALGLLVPVSTSLGLRFGAQLVLLVAFGVLLTYRLLPLTDGVWFGNVGWLHRRRVFGTGVATVFMVTGSVALVTLASSAALRLQPSTQFLQLLSALDIAWAAATVMVAANWLWGRRAALIGGIAVGVVCIATIARYLDAVGFTPRGRWRLDGDALWTYVLPYDMAVAAIALGLFWFAVRRRTSR